jgi:hypothetical protein
MSFLRDRASEEELSGMHVRRIRGYHRVRKPKVGKPRRVCACPGCGTVLAEANTNRFCFLHLRSAERTMFIMAAAGLSPTGKRRSRADGSKGKGRPKRGAEDQGDPKPVRESSLDDLLSRMQ